MPGATAIHPISSAPVASAATTSLSRDHRASHQAQRHETTSPPLNNKPCNGRISNCASKQMLGALRAWPNSGQRAAHLVVWGWHAAIANPDNSTRLCWIACGMQWHGYRDGVTSLLAWHLAGRCPQCGSSRVLSHTARLLVTLNWLVCRSSMS